MRQASARGTDVRGRSRSGAALAVAVAAGACLSAPPSGPVGQPPPGEGGIDLVAEDPFGDGTAVAHLFSYRGWIHLGPSRHGDRLLRLDPDGGGELEEVTIALPRDDNGNSSRNLSPAPFSSIGYTGCAPGIDCGPDDEDGAGLFAPAALGDDEVLIAGGARSAGDVDYVYASLDRGSALAFRYADLSAATGPSSRGFSALHGFAGRVYLGLPDTGGARPYLLALLRAPAAAPGLDAADGTDVLDLRAHDMPGLATDGNALVDAIADFAGNLYLANAGGWMRSTVAAPRPYDQAPSDWADAAPSAAEYLDVDPVTTSKTADLQPADRAVPALAVHQGRLYAARNTTSGPQLWSCDPAAAPPASACDPDDWAAIGGPGEGSAAVSLLVATGAALYVGFDDAGGFRLLRAAGAADFEEVVDPGLGDPALTRLFSATAVAGADTLYLVAGDGERPLVLVRVAR